MCKEYACKKKNNNNKKCQTVTIVGTEDKRSITSIFSITLTGKFLPMQLIYGGKSTKSLPRYQFPTDF